MKQHSIKIVFFSDLHYAAEKNSRCPERAGEYGISLLARMTGTINREIQPDLVLCGGDLINEPGTENARRMTAAVADVMSLIHAPCVAIRGNHDLPQNQFTEYFPFQPVFDLDFLRIVSFDDPETPHYNAVRTPEDFNRMKEAAASWNGILFSFQHTPLTPECGCPYHYENADELLAYMRNSGYRGTFSGHYHAGKTLWEEQNLQFVIQSALCERPFGFSVLEMTRNGIVSSETCCISF